MTRPLRLLDLFSGLGGFSLAGHRVGIQTIAFAEINPFCRKVLTARFPGVPIFEDVTQLTAESLRAVGVREVTFLAGGWPCQGNSVAGKRGGHADERSGLFSEIIRLAEELHPRWLLLENVPGLVSVNGGADFADVIGELRRIGYMGCVRRLDAQHFGLAQRRARLFFVGGLGDAGKRAVHALLEGGRRYPAPRREAGKAAPTIPSRSTAGGGLGTDFDCDGGLIPLLEIGARTGSGGEGRNGCGIGEAHDPMFTLQAGKHHGIAFVQNQRDEVRDLKDCAGAIAAEPGMKQQTYVAYSWDEEINGFEEISGAILRGGDGGRHAGVAVAPAVAFTERGRNGTAALETQEEVGYALRSGRSGRSGEGIATVRRLSPTECERLMGVSWRDPVTGEWQDGHTCTCGKNRGRSVAPPGKEPCRCPDGPRYRSLGNSVAVPVVEWIFRAILTAEEPA